MVKEVLLEDIKWRTQDIEHTALKLVGFYAQTLRVLGTRQWIRFATDQLLPVIKKNSPKPVELDGEGFNLVFRGPHQTPTPILKGNQIIWQEKEPRFVLFDNTYLILAPKLRTLLYRASEAIGEEMRSVYKLTVLQNPFMFIFPKTEYSRENPVYHRAVMLGG